MTLKAGLLALALALTAGGAQAATVLYATEATIWKDVPVRNKADNRHLVANALGDKLGDFFELGYGGAVDFTFGGLFTKSVNIVEVTFGNRLTSALETVEIWGGRNGNFVKLGTMSNRNSAAPLGADLRFSGTFDTLRLVDTTPRPARATTGGFDVDRIAVAPVPVPAAGVLLLGGLAGLVGLKRRRRMA